jgi:uncharacterized cupredoxin-like copper-binding protein
MADPHVGPECHARPRWVKVAIIIGAIALVLAILSLAGVLPGGPGGHGPGRHTGEDRSKSEQSAADVGEPTGAEQAERAVDVTTLDTMAFELETISVSQGETVTFVVTNTGDGVQSSPSEFTLGNAEMQEEHAEAMAHIPAGMGHDTPNNIPLQPGETKELTWRFGNASPVEYACHHASHYEAGMRGRITVS